MTLDPIPDALREEDPTLRLPRLLCLHGGGVNAQIFYLQCRALRARLSHRFRLVFADAPFLCAPHPSIVTVYGDHGPFRRWLRWLPSHPEVDAHTASAEIMDYLLRAMDEDPGTGEWVGLLGFSQGAKIAASLAFTQQLVAEKLGREEARRTVGGGADWKFVVLMAGRAPLVVLDERIPVPPGCADAGQASGEVKVLMPDGSSRGHGHDHHVLKLPTIHVHGLRDPALDLHRLMMKGYCREKGAKTVEWDGGHRVPIKGHDVEAVSRVILDLAEELGLSEGGEEVAA